MNEEPAPHPPEADKVSARGWTKVVLWLVLGTLLAWWLVESGVFTWFDNGLDAYLTQVEEEEIADGENPLAVMNESGFMVLMAYLFFFVAPYALVALLVTLALNFAWRKPPPKPERDIVRL